MSLVKQQHGIYQRRGTGPAEPGACLQQPTKEREFRKLLGKLTWPVALGEEIPSDCSDSCQLHVLLAAMIIQKHRDALPLLIFSMTVGRIVPQVTSVHYINEVRVTPEQEEELAYCYYKDS